MIANGCVLLRKLFSFLGTGSAMSVRAAPFAGRLSSRMSSDLLPKVHHVPFFRKRGDVRLGKQRTLRFLRLVLAIENTQNASPVQEAQVVYSTLIIGVAERCQTSARSAQTRRLRFQNWAAVKDSFRPRVAASGFRSTIQSGRFTRF